MNGLEITAERKKQVRFQKPYYAYRQQLVVRKDDNRNPRISRTANISKASLSAHWTAAPPSVYSQRRKSRPNCTTINSKPTRNSASSDTDAVLMDLPIALYCGPDEKLRFAGEAFAKGNYGSAVRSSDPARPSNSMRRWTDSGMMARSRRSTRTALGTSERTEKH